MYVTSTTTPKTVPVYYTGSRFDRCPASLVKRYFAGNYTTEKSWVRSWRGRKDKSKSHEFERYLYKTGGNAMLWHCNKAGYVDGGDQWMHLLNNHSALSPRFTWSPDGFTVDQTSGRLRDFVVAEMYEKANAARFNSAVFVAELGETIKYVTDIVKSVISITRAYKALAERVINAHGTWLEYRYAVLPLILTVKDALEALNPSRPKEKVQNFKKVEDKGAAKLHVFTYSYGQIGFRIQTTYNRRAGAALEVLFQNDVAPWGTSLQDVIAAGWEIVRLSFVIDWFLDVGQWLGSFRDTNLILGDKYVTQVQETTTKIWVEEGSGNVGPFYICPTPKDPFIVSGFSMRREIADAVVPPSLPVFSPVKLSLLRKLDGLALLLGALLELKRK